ncbi:12303_t:CDS:2 [Entrophospora sp. SA101]|nr:12303_t:CDS:2 [Entrophospora sp. SA101]
MTNRLNDKEKEIFEEALLCARYATNCFKYKDEFGNTALHMASANGHIEIVKFIIDTICSSSTNDDFSIGTLINSQNNSGNTPLHWSALNGHLDVVEILLNHDDEQQEMILNKE